MGNAFFLINSDTAVMPFLYALRVPLEKIALREKENGAVRWWLVKVGMTMGDDDEEGIHDLFRRFYNIGDGIQRFFNCAIDAPQLSRGGNTTPVKGRSLAAAGGAGLAPFQSLHEFVERQRRVFWNKNSESDANVTPFRKEMRGGAYEDLLFVLNLPSNMLKKEVESVEGFVRLCMGGVVRSLSIPLGKSYKKIPDNLNYNEMIVMEREYAQEMQEWFRSGNLHVRSFMQKYGESSAQASFLKNELEFDFSYDDEKVVYCEDENVDNYKMRVSVHRNVFARVAYPL